MTGKSDSAILESLPDRPLVREELLEIDQSDALERAIPMTARVDSGTSYVASAVLLTESEAVAIVFNDGWRVLQRESRPSPPEVLEDAIVEYMDEHYPEHGTMQV